MDNLKYFTIDKELWLTEKIGILSFIELKKLFLQLNSFQQIHIIDSYDFDVALFLTELCKQNLMDIYIMK